MIVIVFIVSILCLAIGNIILNEYEHDSATTLGLLLIILGVSGLIVGLMITSPL